MGSSCCQPNTKGKDEKNLSNQENEIVIKNDDSCYSCQAKFLKRPEIGEKEYIIQIDAHHKGDHSCDEQTLDLVFNNPATYVSCTNGKLLSIANTTRMKIQFNFHIEPNDDFIINELIVEYPQPDLQIIECKINDGK